MKDRKEIEQILRGFYGTEQWHRWSILFKMLLTDGAKAVADECQAYWLMDAIASHQSPKLEAKCDGFQSWKLTVNPDKSAVLECDDGNHNIVARQEIEYTDFPLPSITLWVEGVVILLPSEH